MNRVSQDLTGTAEVTDEFETRPCVLGKSHTCDCGFFPQSKDMHLKLTRNSKLTTDVGLSVEACLSLCWPRDELVT